MHAYARLGMLELLKNPRQHLGMTGLVFAGFGDHDIFPCLVEYKSCGMVAKKHVAFPGSQNAVTHDVPAILESFAQSAMTDTFALGLSEDVYNSVMNELNDGLATFARQLFDVAGIDITANIPDLDLTVAKARLEIGKSILDKARREHALPLRRVLGVLPVEEMAELAETLINLQSLKEKVTKRSETVGGPVDVAVITKNEGLIWIKRKHYFDAGLNSRYMVRQQNRLV
jgi:hypothetical protein